MLHQIVLVLAAESHGSGIWAVETGRRMAATARGLRLAADLPQLIAEDRWEEIVAQTRRIASTAQMNGHLTVGVDGDPRSRQLGKKDPLPLGIPTLDKNLHGGIDVGELFAFLGRKEAGKSQVLIALGANVLRVHRKVFHVSLEMGKDQVRARYDRSLSGLTAEELAVAPDEVKDRIASLEAGLSVLDVSKSTVGRLEAELDKLPWEPDLMIVDYAGILRSPRKGQTSDAQADKRGRMEEVAEDLFELTKRRGLRTLTAYQSNREGTRKTQRQDTTAGAMRSTDIAGCYDVLPHVSGLIVIRQTDCQIAVPGEQKPGELFLDHNRDGPSKLAVSCTFDWYRTIVKESQG